MGKFQWIEPHKKSASDIIARTLDNMAMDFVSLQVISRPKLCCLLKLRFCEGKVANLPRIKQLETGAVHFLLSAKVEVL